MMITILQAIHLTGENVALGLVFVSKSLRLTPKKGLYKDNVIQFCLVIGHQRGPRLTKASHIFTSVLRANCVFDSSATTTNIPLNLWRSEDATIYSNNVKISEAKLSSFLYVNLYFERKYLNGVI